MIRSELGLADFEAALAEWFCLGVLTRPQVQDRQIVQASRNMG